MWNRWTTDVTGFNKTTCSNLTDKITVINSDLVHTLVLENVSWEWRKNFIRLGPLRPLKTRVWLFLLFSYHLPHARELWDTHRARMFTLKLWSYTKEYAPATSSGLSGRTQPEKISFSYRVTWIFFFFNNLKHQSLVKQDTLFKGRKYKDATSFPHGIKQPTKWLNLKKSLNTKVSTVFWCFVFVFLRQGAPLWWLR